MIRESLVILTRLVYKIPQAPRLFCISRLITIPLKPSILQPRKRHPPSHTNNHTSVPARIIITIMANSRSHPPSQKYSHPSTETMPSRRNTTSYSSTTCSIASSTDGIDDTDSTIGRPKLHSRKHSTNLVPRDHPNSEIRKEHFPAGDARAMSPRRTSVEMEKLGRDNRIALQKYVRFRSSCISTGIGLRFFGPEGSSPD